MIEHEQEEELATSRDEAGEPSGEEDPATEQEILDEKEEAEEASEQPQDYLALAQRIQADFENYRKRAAKEAAAAGQRAKSGLVRELLPVVDNLERALASAAEDEGPLAQGVQLVLSDLQGVLAREGVDALEPVGEKFDPNEHEALSTRPEEGAEVGVIVEVVEKGYRTRDSVIRPARVVVSA